MNIYDPNGSSFMEKFYETNLFGDCENVLDDLEDRRVFSLTYNKEENTYAIGEECDGYFGMELSKDDCENLSIIFDKIAKDIR